MARNDMAGDQVCKFHQISIDFHRICILHRFSSIYIDFQSKTISNPITEDVTGTMGHGSKDESVPSLVFIIISAIFIVSPKQSINIQICLKNIQICLKNIQKLSKHCPNIERSEQFFVTECFFNLFLEVSHI